MRLKLNRKVKGFTIAELLVTLVITSVVITLSYTTFNYIHKLFVDYKSQCRFISEYTTLKERVDYESRQCEFVLEQTENKLLFKRDTIYRTLEIMPEVILFKNQSACDTFHITPHKIIKTYEPMSTSEWKNRLLQSLSFETVFGKQKFIFYFHKKYDGSVKMALERNN